VTSRLIRWGLGSSRVKAAITARSAQSSLGLGFCRRSTVTSMRSTSNSASFDAEERASSAIHPARLTKSRYSIRRVTSPRCCQSSDQRTKRTRGSATYASFWNPQGRAWADGYAERDGRWWPRFDPQNVTRDGAGLCVNAGKSGTGWLCAPAWSWPKGPPSTPAALTRCAPSQQRSDPGAQSAGPAAHRIPGARRWLICALYAARVRWPAVRVRSRRSWAHCPVAPGRAG
jgi:hypothetical protein